MDKPVWDDHNNDDKVVDVSFFGTRWFMVILAVIAGILGVVILYYLFSPADPLMNEPPVIESEALPFKIQPADPGGVAIPYQDKEVYERLVPMNGQAEGVVVMAPGPEQPMRIMPEPVEMIIEDKGPQVMVEEITPPVERVIVEEEVEIINLPKPAIKPVGKYKIQVAALHTKALAEKEWGILKRKYKSVLKDENTHISKIDLPKKGVFYRVQVGPFQKKAEAMKVCNALKKKGGACFLVT